MSVSVRVSGMCRVCHCVTIRPNRVCWAYFDPIMVKNSIFIDNYTLYTDGLLHNDKHDTHQNTDGKTKITSTI
jgi:hypothetical protein